MKLTSAKLVTHFSNIESTKWQEKHADHASTFDLSSILLVEVFINGPQSTKLLIRAKMCPATDRTFRMDESVPYAKQNANQLSVELASLVFTRVMEQANKERATTDTMESL